MIKFLNKETLLLFHKDQLARYGGADGLRDNGLFESALAQASATFGGDYVHQDIYEMGAAYGYHICKNHPFIDGNKRTALIAMYIFMHINGYEINVPQKVLYALIMDLAAGKLVKDELSSFLRQYCVLIDRKSTRPPH